MNSAQLGAILRRFRELTPSSAETDAELLARYARGEQAAFARLVERYSGLVWGVGRRILRRHEDGEDVFQATFLALSRKCNSLKRECSLAPWLYTVAARLALNIKRRRRREGYLMEMPEPATLADPSVEVSGLELAHAFDDEMQRLPEKHREALVLCCLEGLSRDEAASAAGCTLAVMKNRLERGRKLLRYRLERRGVAVPATLLLVGLTNRVAPAAVCAAACRVSEKASPAVMALAGEAIAGNMMMKTIILCAALGLTAAGIGIGGSLLADRERQRTTRTTVVAEAEPPAKEAPAEAAKPRVDRFGDPLPEEALARFGTLRFRQGSHFGEIRYSPDANQIAIAGNRSLGLWDVVTGKELFQFGDGKGGIDAPSFCIAFSPDGTILAAVLKDNAKKACSIQLWNTRTGKLIRELKGHSDWLGDLVFSGDARTLISGGYDCTIRFWDVATGQETAKLEKHTGSVLSLALSSDGKLLASWGADSVIRVWDVETRGLAMELQGAGRLQFSPDGKRLYSEGSSCIVWNVINGERVYELDKESKGVQTAVFSPNGKWLAASGKNGDIQLYDPSTGREVCRCNTESKAVETAAFSPNGKWLAAGCSDDTIRLFDPLTGKEVRRWDTQSLFVPNLVFSTDSKTIASVCFFTECGVRFWDVETGKDTRSLDGHRSLIEEMQLSPDGKTLWGRGRMDRRAICWNAATTEAVEVVPMPAKAISHSRGALSPGGAFLAWGSASDKTIHLMDLKTHKDACEPLKIETGAYSVQFSADGKVLAVGCTKGLFYIWKWQMERDPKPLKYPEQSPEKVWIWPRSFTKDGKHLVTGSVFGKQSKTLHVWDVATGREIISFPCPGDAACALAISPDGKWAASRFGKSGVDGAFVKAIDIENGKTTREIKLNSDGSEALVFSPDGRILAFGEDAQRGSGVKLIEFATGEAIATFHGHRGGVFALHFAPDGRTLYSGGGDSTILKWDATARHGQGHSTMNATAAWEALAKEVSKAYPARWDLVDSPKEAVALLRQKIPPAKKLDPKEVARILANLNADRYQDRQKASDDLKSLGYSVEPLLREMVEGETRLEVKDRLQKVIDDLIGPAFLRIRRALEVLETIGNDDAKQLLRELAIGVPDSMLTREAATVLKRMAK